MSVLNSNKVGKIIQILSAKYGLIDWWRGNPEEVIIGAILTQQTRWENVEKGLSNLKSCGINSLHDINQSPSEIIENAIRCTGFYRVKTQRLKNLAAFILEHYGSVSAMTCIDKERLRADLLSVKGIGEETADSILCYGCGKLSFVIDAYTELICRCAGITTKRKGLRALFESTLPKRIDAHRQSHAHIVEYAKDYCGKKRCGECQIRMLSG